MHKPGFKLQANQQDKRSVIPIEMHDIDQWLGGQCGRRGNSLDWHL
jgi:hypothetical protein